MTRRLNSTPTPVGALLTAVLPPLRERLLALDIRRTWADLAGPDVGRRSQPGEIRGGTLTVRVDNSPWLQELRLRESELLSRLQGRYGVDSVKALQFTLGSPRRAPDVTSQRGADRHQTLTPEEEAWVADAASPITDPALAEAVRRLLVKDTLSRRHAGASS